MSWALAALLVVLLHATPVSASFGKHVYVNEDIIENNGAIIRMVANYQTLEYVLSLDHHGAMMSSVKCGPDNGVVQIELDSTKSADVFHRFVGHDVENILGSIRAHQSQPANVDVGLSRSGGDLRISLTPRRGKIGPVDVHLIKITPESTVEIKAGENHGQEITYTDIVREWSTVAEWDGEEPQEFLVKGGAADHVAVIVQGKRMGPIVAAGELE